jgi:hypothetical protein
MLDLDPLLVAQLPTAHHKRVVLSSHIWPLLSALGSLWIMRPS